MRVDAVIIFDIIAMSFFPFAACARATSILKGLRAITCAE